MSDLVFLYAAYTIVWAGVFLYALRLNIDQRKLKKELEILKEVVMKDGRKRGEE